MSCVAKTLYLYSSVVSPFPYSSILGVHAYLGKEDFFCFCFCFFWESRDSFPAGPIATGEYGPTADLLEENLRKFVFKVWEKGNPAEDNDIAVVPINGWHWSFEERTKKKTLQPKK